MSRSKIDESSNVQPSTTKTCQSKHDKQGKDKTKDPRLNNDNLFFDASLDRCVCKKCGKSFKLLAYFKRHVCPPNNALQEKTCCCDRCGKLFPSPLSLKRHQLQHQLPGDPLVCPSCGKSYKDEVNLRRHIWSKHSKPAAIHHQCEMCGFSTANHKYLMHHLNRHLRLIPHVCLLCGKSFQWKNVLKDHIKTVHHNVRAYSCQTCGKQFKQRIALKNHNKVVHIGERALACSLCTKKFVLAQHLRDHIISHQRQKKPKVEHRCHLCNNRPFLDKTCLMVHMASAHSDQKPFVCELCGKGFKLKNGLRAHIQTHSEERTHCCDQCDKTFKMKKDLQKHKERHKSTKDYLCSICGKGFVHKNDVYRHQMVHDPAKCHRIYKPGKYKISDGQLVRITRPSVKEQALRASVLLDIDFDSRANSGFTFAKIAETEQYQSSSAIVCTNTKLLLQVSEGDQVAPVKPPNSFMESGKVAPVKPLHHSFMEFGKVASVKSPTSIIESRKNSVGLRAVTTERNERDFVSLLTSQDLGWQGSWKCRKFSTEHSSGAVSNGVKLKLIRVKDKDATLAAVQEKDTDRIFHAPNQSNFLPFHFSISKNLCLDDLDNSESFQPQCPGFSKSIFSSFPMGDKTDVPGILEGQLCGAQRSWREEAEVSWGQVMLGSNDGPAGSDLISERVDDPSLSLWNKENCSTPPVLITSMVDDKMCDVPMVNDHELTPPACGGSDNGYHWMDFTGSEVDFSLASNFGVEEREEQAKSLKGKDEYITTPIFSDGEIENTMGLISGIESCFGESDVGEGLRDLVESTVSPTISSEAVSSVLDLIDEDELSTELSYSSHEMVERAEGLISPTGLNNALTLSSSVEVVEEAVALIEEERLSTESNFEGSDYDCVFICGQSEAADQAVDFTDEDKPGTGSSFSSSEEFKQAISAMKYGSTLPKYGNTLSFSAEGSGKLVRDPRAENNPSAESNLTKHDMNDETMNVCKQDMCTNTSSSVIDKIYGKGVSNQDGIESDCSNDQIEGNTVDDDEECKGTFCESDVDLQSLDEYLNEELYNDNSLSDLQISRLNDSNFDHSPISCGNSMENSGEAVNSTDRGFKALSDILKVTNASTGLGNDAQNKSQSMSNNLMSKSQNNPSSEDEVDLRSEDLLDYKKASTPKYVSLDFHGKLNTTRLEFGNEESMSRSVFGESSTFLNSINSETPKLGLGFENEESMSTSVFGESSTFLNSINSGTPKLGLGFENEDGTSASKFKESSIPRHVMPGTQRFVFQIRRDKSTSKVETNSELHVNVASNLLRFEENSPCGSEHDVERTQDKNRKEKQLLIDFQMTSCDMFNGTCDAFEIPDSQEAHSVTSTENDSSPNAQSCSSVGSGRENGMTKYTSVYDRPVTVNEETQKAEKDISPVLSGLAKSRCKVMELFTDAEELSHGIIRHIAQRKVADSGLQCGHCETKFKSNKCLRRHRLCCKANAAVDTRKKFTCEECGKCLSTQNNLSIHRAAFHSNVPQKCVCHLCGYECKGIQNLRRHIVCHSSARPFKCDLCQKSFKNREAVRGHLVIHLPTKMLYNCDQCEKWFNHCASLQAHKLTHRSDSPALACDICGKTFSDKSNLAAHKKRHLLSSGVTCPVCSKPLSSAKSLQVHQGSACTKYQIKKRRLELKNEKCLAKLARREIEEEKKNQKKRREERKEEMKEKLVCPVCHRQFQATWLLASHMPVHSEERPYLCDICGKAFKRITSVNFHRKLQHFEREKQCN